MNRARVCPFASDVTRPFTRPFTRVLALVVLVALIVPGLLIAFASPAACAETTPPATSPFESFTKDWQTDAVWFDGQAEDATYDAVRVIYSQPRRYEATFYTNTELASAETKTKSDSDKGRPVFKLHIREDIATENYVYHFSTMCYVGRPDLKSLKIDFGSMEDCGASFKQLINHAGELSWQQYSYFPNEGQRSGAYAPPINLAYFNALPLVLRGYPFEQPRDIVIELLPDQVSARWTKYEPAPASVRYIAKETLNLPIGQVEAHHLRVTDDAGRDFDYWFHADGSAPLLHVMVQYHGPDGLQYRLKNHRRWAYWNRQPKDGQHR